MFWFIFWLFYFLCGAFGVYILYKGMCNDSYTTTIRSGEELTGYLFAAAAVFVLGWLSLGAILCDAWAKKVKRANGGVLFKFGGAGK